MEDSKVKTGKDEICVGKLPAQHQQHLPILNVKFKSIQVSFGCLDFHAKKFLMQGMVLFGRVDLLSHDLSQKYLQMKWNAYGKYFQLANLLLYLLYLVILTAFATSSYNKDSHHYNQDGILTAMHLNYDRNCSGQVR